MTEVDAEAVYDAGWDETSLVHAICVCSVFNLMNRVVEDCGIRADAETVAARRLRHSLLRNDPEPYPAFGRQLGVSR